MTKASLLNVKNLNVSFMRDKAEVCAVDGIAINIASGQIVGLVGESGCGKSLTGQAIMGLLRHKRAVRVSGEVDFQNKNLLGMSEKQLRSIRGNEVAMIFQEPLTSLNPVFTIGNQLVEAYRLHQRIPFEQAYTASVEILKSVNIPDPVRCMGEYPHQLSGGMRQRVMIAMALTCDPKVLIADEPTTALDVTIQAQILRLLLRLREERDMGILLITHDLGVVAQVCDVVNVMYGGHIVEKGTVEDVLFSPRHPYTKGLIRSMPKIGNRRDKLQPLKGHVPALGQFPKGCRFRNRCEFAFEKCSQTPKLGAEAHPAACWLIDKGLGA